MRWIITCFLATNMSWGKMAEPQNCYQQSTVPNSKHVCVMNEASENIELKVIPSKVQSLIGAKFNYLEVIGYADFDGAHRWWCKCACGSLIKARGANLKSGNTKSCFSCGRIRAANAKRTHGLTETKFYGVWQAMLNRCRNKNLKDSARYIGRVKVCERWMKFENFYEDMYLGYAEGLSIDRVNNNGHYEPGNCRWTTPTVQANNRHTNHMITWNGATKSLAEWCRETGKNYGCVSYRLSKGWSTERAFS
jgi:hypothetical protein